MTSINDLQTVDVAQDADSLPLYSQLLQSVRKLTLAQMYDYIKKRLTAVQFVQNLLTESATYTVPSYNSDLWVLFTNPLLLSSATVKLPDPYLMVNVWELCLTSVGGVTALTVNPNGATSIGLPTTLPATTSVRIRYEPTTATWYRV